MKKFGFTLAEVLITLGIIGVVAALTLPSLNTNVSTRQTGVALSKAFNTLSGANRRIIQDNELRSLSDLTPAEYIKELAEYIDCSFDGETSVLKGKDGITYSFGNIQGAFINGNSHKYTGMYFPVGIDINGDKGPNSSNIDRFLAVVDTSGIIVPEGGTEAVNHHGSSIVSCTSNNQVGTKQNAYGQCTDAIISAGWKVEYVTSKTDDNMAKTITTFKISAE